MPYWTPIVGCLKAAGVFEESDLSLARTILYPVGTPEPTSKEEESERKTKASTLANYIGQSKKRKHEKIYYWVLDWMKDHPAES